eukprot:7649470-Heterocapsa_arctica.AAC.1
MILEPPSTPFVDDFYAADAWSEHPDFPTDADPPAAGVDAPAAEAEPDTSSEDDSDDDSGEPIDY